MKRLATMAAGYGPGVDQPICMIEERCGDLVKAGLAGLEQTC
jgi:hypothetical protein